MTETTTPHTPHTTDATARTVPTDAGSDVPRAPVTAATEDGASRPRTGAVRLASAMAAALLVGGLGGFVVGHQTAGTTSGRPGSSQMGGPGGKSGGPGKRPGSGTSGSSSFGSTSSSGSSGSSSS